MLAAMSDVDDNGRVSTKAVSDTVLERDEIHEEWEEQYLTPEMDRFYDRAFDEIAKRLHAPRGARLLDAGCGYCFHAVRLARHGFDVTAVDFSEAALAQARKYLETVGMQDEIELGQANLLDLPFEDESWDYVHCWGVLMHIPHLEQALRELSRVVKPGGKLVIMENNMRSLHVQVYEPLLRMLKTVLGRDKPTRARTERGIESWYQKPGGEMIVRMTDMDFLERFMAEQGMTLEDRFAGQLSELYTSVPIPAVKRALQMGNELYLDKVGAPGISQGNILIFRKG